MKINELVGETLTHVDVFGDDEIMLTTESGRKVRICHHQECCETVVIENTHGEWASLYGKVLVEAAEDIEDASDERCESATRTTLKFAVDDATVINRWFGCSNGYYSETISFDEIDKN